jgi:regulator of sigma E protease
MTILIYILATCFTLGAIVILHELGHFMVAKLFGVRIAVFSVGFGNRIWGFTKGGTEYRLAALPLGGYVRMGGELAEESTGDPSDFVNKPRWQRILIYLAGPAMNLLLSLTVVAALFMIGFTLQGLQDLPSVIGTVDPEGAGAKAGLQPGDRVVAIDGKPLILWKDLEFEIATAPERTLKLEIERSGERRQLELVPAKVPRYEYGRAGLLPRLPVRLSVIFDGQPAARAGFESGDSVLKVDGVEIATGLDFIKAIEGKAGRQVEIEFLRRTAVMKLPVTPEAIEGKGRIGVKLDLYRQLPLGEAIAESWRYNLEIVDKIFQVLGKLFTRQIGAKSAFSGPIEMAKMSGEAAQRGLDELFNMMAFLSISIGILNLLPIPLLDGGQIFILLIESVLRRDLSLRVKERFAQAGFMILMVLMATVIFFDLSKNLPELFGAGGG